MISRVFRSRNLITYATAWVVVMFVHFLLLLLIYRLNFQDAIADSMVYNLCFALIGIGLWMIVEFTGMAGRTIRESWVQYVTMGVLSVFVWDQGSTGLLGLLRQENTAYLSFLEETRTMRIVSGALYYLILMAVLIILVSRRTLVQQKQREDLLMTQLREAELNMLKSQIRPHFLFNSLNSISALTLDDPEKAREMVVKLSDFMRYSLTFQGESMSTLSSELYHIRLFLDIEKVRFGERLLVEYDICETCGSWPLPSMILQPLIENAVKFGVYESTGPSWIRVEAKLKSPVMMQVRISNPFEAVTNQKRGTGTGLANTSRRLATVYGIPGLLSPITENDIFTVQINFPQHGKDQSDHH
ncbi:MAG TPA: histidine kinase [Bacteroidales bacterium]|nr:histidine kinase [Bacteroidales bacterium]HSA44334.1 histidine kinase [Bacteroidales bacterium]